MRHILRPLAAAAVIAAVTTSLARAAELINLGDLPGGEVRSEAWGVSRDGSTVVGFSKGSYAVPEGFRWTRQTGLVSLGSLSSGSRRSQAIGVSADGSHVVGYTDLDNGGSAAFMWTQTGGMVSLGDSCTRANSVDRVVAAHDYPCL